MNAPFTYSPFDDASGKQLLVFLKQHGIEPEGSISGNIIPTQDGVFTLGDSTHTWGEIWGTLIGATISSADFSSLLNVNNHGFSSQFQFILPADGTGAINVSGLGGGLICSLTQTDVFLTAGQTMSAGAFKSELGAFSTKAGSNLKAGTFTANGTTPVTVSNTSITAGSVIIPTLKTVGGTVGALPAVKTITPSSGFTIAATALDISVYNYVILETY